jgi:hypothetical protein
MDEQLASVTPIREPGTMEDRIANFRMRYNETRDGISQRKVTYPAAEPKAEPVVEQTRPEHFETGATEHMASVTKLREYRINKDFAKRRQEYDEY